MAQGGYGAAPTSQAVAASQCARAHANPLIVAFASLLELAPELERAMPRPPMPKRCAFACRTI